MPLRATGNRHVVLARPLGLRHGCSLRKARKREFNVIVERDAEGYYVASVPELPGCHTQARSLAKLMERIREAIEAFQISGVKLRPGKAISSGAKAGIA